MKSNAITRSAAIIAGIASMIHTAIAAPFSANRTPNGWEEVPLVEAVGAGSALYQNIAVSEDEVAAILKDGRVVVLNEADASVRLISDAPADFPKVTYENFGDAYSFIEGKLVVATLVGLQQVRIDEMDIHTGEWLRSSSQTTTLHPQSLKPPVLEGGILTVYGYIPSAGRFQWNQSDWTVHIGSSAASNPGVAVEPKSETRSLAGPQSIPANKLHIATGISGSFMPGLSIFDPKRLGVDPVRITMPASDYDYAGASKSALWLMDSFANRGNGMGGMICRFPITPMPQVVEIKLTNTKASEHDGEMRFKITASPVPILPVTVELETAPGSAEEGLDYAHWTGNIVLTATKPSAEVSIKLMEDQKLEWCETFLLKVKNISNAWCFDRDAVGVIKGTAFARTVGKEPLPDGKFTYPPQVVGTPAGILALRELNNYRGYRLIFCAAGTSNWVDWSSKFAFLNEWNYLKIEDAQENRVCISGLTDSISSTPASFAIIDTSGACILAQGTKPQTTSEQRMLLQGDSILAPSPASTWTTDSYALFRLPDLIPLWTSSSEWAHYFRHSQGVFLVEGSHYLPDSNPSSGLHLRSLNDASWIRRIQLPLGTEVAFRPVAGGDGICVFDHNGLYLHHLAENGSDLYQLLPDLSGEVMIGSSRVCFVKGNSAIRAIDPETGAVLARIEPPRNHHGFSASVDRGNLLIGEKLDKVTVYVTQPSLPCPATDEIFTNEGADPEASLVGLTESVSYPLYSKLIWCSSTQDIISDGAPAVTPAGSSSLNLPFRIADDDIPERSEKLQVVVEISGAGHSERFELDLTIGEDEIAPFLEGSNSNLVICSSLALGDGTPFVGAEVQHASYDPVHRSAYHPASLAEATNRFYGHAVACSKHHAVVGSPAVGRINSPGLVYVYDRRSRSQTALISHGGTGSAFGSVLHLNGRRLYVGAPGEPVAGQVLEYSMPDGKSTHSFAQPGENRKGNRFGIAIISDGKSVWIGASGTEKGVVYQFSVDTGSLVRVIRPKGSRIENFGHSLSIAGSFLAVGAPSKTSTASVFIYQKATGKLVKTIRSPFKDGGYFGASLANLKEDALAVGCPAPKFAPYGGVLVYDVKSNPCRLKVMLEPSMEPTNLHGQRYGVAGFAGSLCSYGDFLGIRVAIADNPLRLTNRKTASNGYAEILKLSFPDSKPKSALVERTQGGEWSRALRLEPGDPLPEIHLQWENGAVNVSLPNLEDMSSAFTVILERSEDLAAWNPIARYSGSSQTGWVSLSTEFPITKSGGGERLRAMQGKRMFFRLKCETREAD